jgi:hypothetical protein
LSANEPMILVDNGSTKRPANVSGSNPACPYRMPPGGRTHPAACSRRMDCGGKGSACSGRAMSSGCSRDRPLCARRGWRGGCRRGLTPSHPRQWRARSAANFRYRCAVGGYAELPVRQALRDRHLWPARQRQARREHRARPRTAHAAHNCR